MARPLKFETNDALSARIDDYFEITPKEEWTITGLALALDTSRQTLINYEERGEYFDTIKRAKLIVENGYEIDLKKHGRTGTIFALKNFDWKDKNETDVTTKGDKITGVVILPAKNIDANTLETPTETSTSPGTN